MKKKMDVIILKTNINSKREFATVKKALRYIYDIKECTVDLEDIDKVLRVIGINIDETEIAAKVSSLGFKCEELL